VEEGGGRRGGLSDVIIKATEDLIMFLVISRAKGFVKEKRDEKATEMR
jgi:hypothetical protein